MKFYYDIIIFKSSAFVKENVSKIVYYVSCNKRDKILLKSQGDSERRIRTEVFKHLDITTKFILYFQLIL